jgi:hypothetical protein
MRAPRLDYAETKAAAAKNGQFSWPREAPNEELSRGDGVDSKGF